MNEDQVPQNQPITEQPAQPVVQPQTPPKNRVNFKSKKIIIIFGILLVLIVIIVGIFIFANSKNDEEVANLGNKSLTESDLSDQNERLGDFRRGDISDEENQKLNEQRKKVLAFAEQNNISVTDEEITTRKNELVEESGQQAINETLASYGWTEEDWTEVVRWQILREKLFSFIQPSRSGEVLSLRWDIFSPELNQAVADQRSPLAIEYLTLISEQLQNGQTERLYDVFSTFDIRNEEIFEGNENNYGIQYSGWDPSTNSYQEFLITPDSEVYDFIYSQEVPSVSQVECTLGGCQIYNITSGNNGDPANEEILNIIIEDNITF